MFCMQCGARCEPGNRFCARCGSRLASGQPEPPREAAGEWGRRSSTPLLSLNAASPPFLKIVFCSMVGLLAPWLALKRSATLFLTAAGDLRHQYGIRQTLQSLGFGASARLMSQYNSEFFWFAICALLLDIAFSVWALKLSWTFFRGAPANSVSPARFLFLVVSWVVARSVLLPGIFAISISGDTFADVLLLLVAFAGFRYLRGVRATSQTILAPGPRA
jgi:hypothetical protein